MASVTNVQCNALKNTILELISDIRTNVLKQRHEIESVAMVELFLKGVDAKELMNIFVKDVLPISKHVRSRNEKYFKSNIKTILGVGQTNCDVAEGDVDYYEGVWDARMSEEDKSVIWDYMIKCVEIAELFRKVK